MSGFREVSIKAGKILGFVVLGIICLLIAAILLVRLPSVQNRIVGELERYLQDTLQTEVNIERAFIGFPSSVQVEGLYLEDRQGDTLLYISEVGVATNLWELLDSRLTLNSITAGGLVARVEKITDSTYNFSFIMEAFTPAEPQPEDTTASSFEVRIGDVELSAFDIRYRERATGLNARLGWSELLVELDELDPMGSHFVAEKIWLSNAAVLYDEGEPAAHPRQSDEPAETTEAASGNLIFEIRELGINETDISVKSQALTAGASIQTFGMNSAVVKMAESLAAVGAMVLENSIISVEMPEAVEDTTRQAGAREPVVGSSAAADTASAAWAFTLGDLSLKDNEIHYDVAGTEKRPGFDANHLAVNGLSGNISDLVFDGPLIQASISSFTFREGNEFTLFDSGAGFYLSDTTLKIDDLDIHTRESHIRGQASFHFTSMEEIASPGTRLHVNIANSYIHPSELEYFSPGALDSLPVRKPFNFPVLFEAQLSGTVGSLNVATFELKLLEGTELTLSGDIAGLPDPERLHFDLSQIQLVTSSANLHRLLSDSLIPSSVRLPQQLELAASASGSIDTLRVNAALSSSYGGFELRAHYNATRPGEPVYNLDLGTDGFDLGSFLRDSVNFRQLALQIGVNGKGANPDSITAHIEGTIRKVDYQRYVYNDISIEGEVTSKLFNGNVSIDDENLRFTFDGDIDYGSGEMSYVVDLDLEYADLEALNLSATPLVLKAQLDSDIQTEDFTRFRGDLTVREFSASNGIGTYRVDSLIFASIEQEGKTDLRIDSDLMEGYFRGDIDIVSLPAVISQHIDRYYDLDDYDAAKADSLQDFEFYLDLKKTDLLTEILVPQIESIDPGVLEGRFDSKAHQLDLSFSINEMVYGDITLDSLFIMVESGPDELLTKVDLNKLTSSNAVLHGFDFDASLSDNIFHLRLEVPDSAGAAAYLVKGNFESLGASAFRFAIDPDTLRLAYNPWEASQNNYLLFEEQGFSAHNFNLTSGDQRISVEGAFAKDSLARIVLENFSLGELANVLKKGDEILSGTLNARVELAMREESFGLAVGVQITGLGYMGNEWGDLDVDIGNQPAGAYQVDVALEGPNALHITGTYDTDSAARVPLNFNIDLDKLDLAVFGPLAGESVRALEGTLSGTLDVSGSASTPMVNGRLRLRNTSFVPSMLNTKLSVDEETIGFENSVLVFDQFTFTDSSGSTASLDGTVAIENTSFYRFDLSLAAENFQVLNTTSEDNEMYYGKLAIDADASITGTSARPDVNFDLEVRSGSELTYVLVETQEQVLNQPNVVKFVNPADTLAPQNPDATDSLAYSFQGMDLTANLELNDNSVLNIVIDPITQDQLMVRGNANLSLEMNRQGDLSLSGKYTLSEGSYQLSFYQVVKRNFNIRKGSTITWTGDPLNAQLDITAITTVEAQPIDLVANQISNMSSQEATRYRQILPFEVALNIDGQLSAPEISFGLDMPEDSRNALEGSVYAKIQEINTRESDLNKQVFALLVLKRFISENPLASEGGTSFEDNARRSVSRLLSDQLNKLTDDIGGIQLDVNLESYEDYSSGEAEDRTDLEVGVSKTLFDERLTVKVAGNVALEGNRQQQQDLSDYIGDLLLEYKLTEDGRLRLLGFRRNEFDLVNGQIIETGTGVIYVRDYNKFKELFKLNEDEEDEK